MIGSLIADNFTYPAVIFITMILIWVGSSMWLTHFSFDAGESKVMVRNGGVVLLTGLLLGGAIKYWRSARKA